MTWTRQDRPISLTNLSCSMAPTRKLPRKGAAASASFAALLACPCRHSSRPSNHHCRCPSPPRLAVVVRLGLTGTSGHREPSTATSMATVCLPVAGRVPSTPLSLPVLVSFTSNRHSDFNDRRPILGTSRSNRIPRLTAYPIPPAGLEKLSVEEPCQTRSFSSSRGCRCARQKSKCLSQPLLFLPRPLLWQAVPRRLVA